MNELQKFFQTSVAPVDSLAQSLWWIIALPLLGAAVCGLMGKRLGRGNVSLIATCAVGGSFLLSLLAFWAVNDRSTMSATGFTDLREPYVLAVDYGTWFAVADFRVNFGLMVDH